MTTHHAAVVAGAGQAGLAAAHTLMQRGLEAGVDFVVLDANEGPGGAWRHRWDSLTLGKAHGIADLPGLPMERPDPVIPASELVSDYYGAYEDFFELSVIRPARVVQVTSPEGLRTGPLDVTYETGERTHRITTDHFLNATGTWDNPFIPWVPGLQDFEGRQLHTVDYVKKEDFAGQRVLVVGGGLSAVQFLLELEPVVAATIWATRRPPNFTDRGFDERWGLDVESAVRERTGAGLPAASVVRTTGIPMIPEYVRGVERGLLVSRGRFERVLPRGVRFGTPLSHRTGGLGPSVREHLALPASWDPFPPGHEVEVDVIFWNTGFRPALRHLAPLKLRHADGGIRMDGEVRVAADPRVWLVGYGSTASTIGATRAGRRAGADVARRINASR